ncbi:Aldo/keto reductase [Thozetella sp. PMI_491]|nr:Aldo/keto reductase [Thozetella sp. PMI_491]
MAANPMLARKVRLHNGMSLAQIQLGLYEMSGSEASKAVRWALAAGYRGFDSAQWYANERQTGQAILDFLSSADNVDGLTREDINYTSKLRENSTAYDTVRKSIKKSVEACGLGYIDLFLLHSPYGGKQARLTSWKAVEDAVADGEIKMAGVSNYGVKHIEELMASSPKVHPVVNQIEVHPFNTQEEIRAVCEKHNIAIEAYAPLARAYRFDHPTMVSLSKQYGCTVQQLMVRWSIQHGFITLPKSTRRDRLIKNADVGAFEISEKDMQTMDGLDEGLVTDWDPTNAP